MSQDDSKKLDDFTKTMEGLRKAGGQKRVEQFVIRLLERCVIDSKGSMQVNEGSGFDAVASSGLDDIPGPTIIDITHRLVRIKGVSYWPRLKKYARERAAQGVLLVSAGKVDEDRKSWVKEKAAETLPGVVVAIWGPAELISLVEKYPDAVGDLAPELGGKAIAAVVQKTNEDWKAARTDLIRRLGRIFLSDRLTVFLGSGASDECGLPNWNTLISRLAVQMVQEESVDSKKMNENEKQAVAEAMVHSETSPLLIASYLQNSLGPRFREKLAGVLYSGVKPASASKLIGALTALCRPTRSRKGLFAVVSYNFDNLLEEALGQATIPFRSIGEEGVLPEADELPIYHVHGILPHDEATPVLHHSAEDQEESAVPNLVFTEDAYFRLQSDHYSWANFEQLKLLRETTCLLIGLSGTDPNLRRLLYVDAERSKRAKHFIFLKRQTVENLLGSATSVRQDIAQHYLDVHHSLQEKSFLKLGLNVLWLDSYDEIADLLGQFVTEQETS